MADDAVRLEDKFDLTKTRQILTGTQAVVRLTLMQKERDEAAGLNTAGYVTGYRGSPIATLESAFTRYRAITEARNILFQPGLNEDIAATAIWGAQQAELRNEGKYDGVFAIWYGKGPGVDRSGDAFRHANHAGTSKHGGVLALMGDDHTCESSTSAHQSEFAFVDAMMPILNPAGVQEILDYGIYGFALSRFAGVWVGMKCVKDNIESTATVDGDPNRIQVRHPAPEDARIPEGGLNIRLGDPPLVKEARLHGHKRRAILSFARANKLDRTIWDGGPAPKIGIITTGKSYLDTRQALSLLGIDEARAGQLGLRLYKVAMTWPLEPRGIATFAEGLDTVIVVEEKRSLIETQLKEQLYDQDNRPKIIGKRDEANTWLFPASGALDPLQIAIVIGDRLAARNSEDRDLKAARQHLNEMAAQKPEGVDPFPRIPYFCAGCPHNSSTIIPDGDRAYAGIGCHYMVQWMDRATEGFTQMGAEGANWIGEAPFSTRRHIFQNIGDGTYIHSGVLAIRAAIAANTNITFKILYNDAVAMTGGQTLDGNLTVEALAAQVAAEGVKKIAIVTDEPNKYGFWPNLPRGTKVYHRRSILPVQKALSEIPGVTALIYDQTCATEKRRRRKRGTLPDADRRVFINAAVCEGCGDCGVQSNCIAVLPLETEFGRKRQIDQSACNNDLSCVEGFCPSFMTLEGAKPKKRTTSTANNTAAASEFPSALPDPKRPDTTKPFTLLVSGVGGTGVVTVSAILGEAAHIDGKAFGAIDMTGLAQKGGAVSCHIRIADRAEDIHAIRAGTAGADAILAGDLVVAAGNAALDTVRKNHTAIALSSYEMTTGDFTRTPDLKVPGSELLQRIRQQMGGAPLFVIDAQSASNALFGDAIAANMLILGFAYQHGLVPVSARAIETAIQLNGTAVDMNVRAFRMGRLAAADRDAFDAAITPESSPITEPQTFEEQLARLSAHLTAYQDTSLARRFEQKVRWAENIERSKTPGQSGFASAVMQAYHKLLTYKDEYEVARLLTDSQIAQEISDNFEGTKRISYHLAPPFLGRLFRHPATGHPTKIRFGSWLRPILIQLARLRSLRGSRWDLFGYTKERRLERQMIADYEKLLDELATGLRPDTHALAIELALTPLAVKGFGHIKLANHRNTVAHVKTLLAAYKSTTPPKLAAE